MEGQSQVVKASKQLYVALNRMLHGDPGPLGDIWSHGTSVTTMHPVGGREVGWGKVNRVWQQVAKVMSGGRVRLGNQLIRVAGDMAYEAGTEQGWLKIGGARIRIKHRVTNIYRREAGTWKIIHHHTDLSPAMVEVLGRL